jgi:hypothetical protein
MEQAVKKPQTSVTTLGPQANADDVQVKIQHHLSFAKMQEGNALGKPMPWDRSQSLGCQRIASVEFSSCTPSLAHFRGGGK